MPANYLSCDLNALLKASVCLQQECLSEPDRLARDIIIRIAELAAAGGANYTASGSSVAGLMKAAKQWTGGLILNCQNRQAIGLYLDYQNAVANGATLLPIANFGVASAQLRHLSEDTLKDLALFLKCQLNSIAKPE